MNQRHVAEIGTTGYKAVRKQQNPAVCVWTEEYFIVTISPHSVLVTGASVL